MVINETLTQIRLFQNTQKNIFNALFFLVKRKNTIFET